MGLFLCCQFTQRAEMGLSPGRRLFPVIVVVTSRTLAQVLIRLKKVPIISPPPPHPPTSVHTFLSKHPAAPHSLTLAIATTSAIISAMRVEGGD